MKFALRNALAVFGLLAAIWSGSLNAQADPKSEAEQSSSAFLTGLQSADLSQLYEMSIAARAKTQFPKDMFVQNTNVFRIQSGGPPLARMLIGSTPVKQLQTGEVGDFYYVRYRETFSSGQFFADVMLEHIDSKWLVTWYNYTPAPPQ